MLITIYLLTNNKMSKIVCVCKDYLVVDTKEPHKCIDELYRNGWEELESFFDRWVYTIQFAKWHFLKEMSPIVEKLRADGFCKLVSDIESDRFERRKGVQPIANH